MRRISARILLLTLPILSAPGQQQAPAEIAPAPPPLLLNTGKPIQLPFLCSEDDIQWAGLSCSEEEPCPIYLELDAVEAPANKIVVAGNIHSSAVTLYSVLLASDNGGAAWREPFQRIRGAALDRVQFFDPDTGWVSGQMMFPLPQDPFLLVTSDGGATWRRRPITNDGHYGSIQQFAFTTKNNGSLVIDRGPGSEGDRYELYESQNGGDDWIIRQESTKLIQLKRSPAPAAGEWRVRADGPSQSFQVERRQGERWTKIASFAVKLAPCKPPRPGDETPAPKKQPN